MMDIKDFYILGLPIRTEIGNCHFLKVREYPDYFMDLQAISLTKSHLISKYNQIYAQTREPLLKKLIVEFEKLDLFTLVTTIPELCESYIRIFSNVFNNDEIFSSVNESSFEYYRHLIMEMNYVKEEVVNPNPEIQEAIERSRRVKSVGNDKLEFADIISSVVGFNGLSYQDINDFTVYQLYMTFYRISQIKNYDTSTLFATVSADKVKIESWSKHINFYEEESHSISKDEFDNTSNSLFGSNK